MWVPEIPQFLHGRLGQEKLTVGPLEKNKDGEQREEGRGAGKGSLGFPRSAATLGEAFGAWGSGQLHFLWNKEMGEEHARLSYPSFCFNSYST